jgi:hypothetical protein
MNHIPTLFLTTSLLAASATPSLAGPIQKRICIKNTVTTPARVVETLTDFYVEDVNGAYASLAGMVCSTLPDTGIEECFPASGSLIVRNGLPEFSYEATNSITTNSIDVLQIENGHFTLDPQSQTWKGGAFVGRVVNGSITWQTFNPITAEPVTCPVTPKADRQALKNLIDRLAKASR